MFGIQSKRGVNRSIFPDPHKRLRPRIFARVADEAASRVLAERLKLFGYQCWRASNPLFNPDNFYRHDQDVFSGRAAHAILAIPEEIDVDVALDGCVQVK